MSRCYFTPAAETDLEDIGDYIAEDNPSRAKSFVRELRERCEKLCDFPLAYPLRPNLGANVRVLAYRGYLICYTAHADGRLVIERISEGSRNIEALFR